MPLLLPLQWAGAHGRLLLVLGLVGGFLLPGVAQAMKPLLPTMVAFLVFVSALRIGARDALGRLHDAGNALRSVLIMQLVLPLLVVGLLWIVGWQDSVFAIALILAVSGSSISGAPTFTALMGHPPDGAMRLLIMGTLLLPLTILPVFLMMPGLGDTVTVVWAAVRLCVVLAIAITAAFTLRRIAFPNPSPNSVKALDGLAALTLAIIVVGLMAGIGPAMRDDPVSLLPWMGLVFAVNFGQQVIARLFGASVSTSVVAGNRNIALFLVALPVSITDPLLLFIGCYQIPMYLTPLVMKLFYART